MKKQILKAIGGASLVILMLAVFAQVWVSAHVQKGNQQGLVGSWDVEVTIRDCQTGAPLFSFPAAFTYNQGGTMQSTDLGPPVVITLPGHGVWQHETGREYSAAVRRLTFNPDRTFAGTGVVRSAISLGLSGDTYTSTDTFAFLDANGDIIPGSEACATETATRFK